MGIANLADDSPTIRATRFIANGTKERTLSGMYRTSRSPNAGHLRYSRARRSRKIALPPLLLGARPEESEGIPLSTGDSDQASGIPSGIAMRQVKAERKGNGSVAENERNDRSAEEGPNAPNRPLQDHPRSRGCDSTRAGKPPLHDPGYQGILSRW